MGRKFTVTEDNFIRNNLNKIPAKRISALLGRGETSVRQRFKILGIQPSTEAINKFKLESQFKPGEVPPNKGKKQSEYMSKEAIAKTINTRFKKGLIPKNTLFDGAKTIRTDSDTGRKYYWIRLAKMKWQMLHVITWQATNGKIPKGEIVVFKNGNSLDVRLENLEMISRKENMLRNTVQRYPDQLRNLMQLNGRVKKKIIKAEQNGKG